MASSRTPNYDVIIVGAGFSGIRALWEVRRLGLSAKCIEAGTDVGGVWYWNRYPGARTDSEGWVYSMNFAPGARELWNYSERYPSQKEVQRYLGSITDGFDMRRHIQFNTQVKSAHYGDEDGLWTVTTTEGVPLTSRYFIAATGPLSVAKKPPFAGLASFKGEWYQTSNWPKQAPDFHGKRVVLVGTGATGVQLVPKLAPVAKELVVVQRTANFVLPGRNYVLDADEAGYRREHYDETWTRAQNHSAGLPMESSGITTKQMTSEAETRRVLDKGWEAGGFHMQFETFDDIFTDMEANTVVSNYLRDKIRAVVQDPATAELLCPQHPFLAKRPPCGHFYYEAFNRPNVQLVDISHDAIDVTPTGIRTLKAGADYPADVIVFALGFDAATGALCEMDVRGRAGKSLKTTWDNRIETFAGSLVPGFPNMFIVCGPHIPFGNMPVVLDRKVTWIGQTIEYMLANQLDSIDVRPQAVEAFLAELEAIHRSTIFAEASQKSGAWHVGANIEGKTRGPLFYFGGVPGWIAWLNKEAKENWPSMIFGKAKVPLAVN